MADQNPSSNGQIHPGEIISYLQMCAAEGISLQRGMNFRMRHGESVILMSVRPNAPYADKIEDDGKTLIYEGHDIPNRKGGPEPKTVDQPFRFAGGSLTQNGLFFEAAKRAVAGEAPEIVRVYDKIRDGIWAFAGRFHLIDAWPERSNGRQVFKFKLRLIEEAEPASTVRPELDHTRVIPTAVKIEVWKRDKGKCVVCESSENLHYDHVIPYSKGGSSLVKENIQLMCARHNLQKHDRIM